MLEDEIWYREEEVTVERYRKKNRSCRNERDAEKRKVKLQERIEVLQDEDQLKKKQLEKE